MGGTLVIHRAGPAGQHNPGRLHLLDLVERDRIGMNLAIDFLLPDAPGNELGVLRAEVEDQDPVDEIPVVGLFLNQNYPNPFNPMTTIAFELPRAGAVDLVVYDVAGKQVKRLVAGDVVVDNRTGRPQQIEQGAKLANETRRW